MAAFEYGLYVTQCQSCNFFLMTMPPNVRRITEKTFEVARKTMACNKAPTQDIATTEAIACKDPEVAANVLRFNIP